MTLGDHYNKEKQTLELIDHNPEFSASNSNQDFNNPATNTMPYAGIIHM